MNNLLKIFGGLFIVVGLVALSGFLHAQNTAPPVQAEDYVPTDGLWLEITSVSNELVCLNLHNATNLVYEIWSKTNLQDAGWNIEMELWSTDTLSMPFTLPLNPQLSTFFVWARDWTAVTGNGNTTPEWWFWKYFGTVELSDTNLDSHGNTLLHDYQNGIDPVHCNGTAPMMAVGGERILELTGDGDVIVWGGNLHGDLGDDTHLDSNAPLLQNNVPVHVAGLTNIIKIASGLNHSLAIDSSGTLWAWGQNNHGQLGDGGCENNASLPLPIPGMTNTIAIAAHGYMAGSDGEYGLSLAVEADGTVWEWGGADGYGFGGYSPVQVSGISNVVSVAAGATYALALKNDGTVWAWGVNSFGQLGNGTRKNSNIPVQVAGLSNIVAICAGDNHSLAIDSEGNVWAWGVNWDGQLGDGGMENYRDIPVMVAGFTNAVGVAAGANHSLAVDGEGGLWAWGYDGSGQLGDGGPGNNGGQYKNNLPAQIFGMTNIISIAAGSDASVALDGNGKLWQWGCSDSDRYWRNGGYVELWAWGDENGLPALTPQYDDFYKGQLPELAILNGNNQVCHAGLEFRLPLAFQVTDTNGEALSNAPVSVEVVAGDMELRAISGGDNYKGLRLTTDTDGGVFLIGYADQNFYNADCVIKVLAASRGQIVEADFHETLIPPPTISITSPTDGGTYLIGTNRALNITVDAEASPGASIQEVDYYFGTNGVADATLGVSTQSPYSFIWNDSFWWTNAFVGQYTLSAVAVDDAGAQSDPQDVNITIALDSDGSGMPDYWQLQCFGNLGVDPGADPDGDGASNLQEYQNGTDPTDYYDGNLPVLELLSGNDQAGNYDSFLPLPVTIQVAGADHAALANAPVTFTVTNGTALLAATTNDAPVTSLTLRTDSNGQVSVRVYFPAASVNPPDSTIVVSASSGTGSNAVIVNEFVPLGHWTFNDTNTWIGEEGQLPLLATNVAGIPSWSGNAVLVDNTSPARIAYNVVETNGNANINCQRGSMLFWFKPDWSSANAGGNGPGTCGRLIEMGAYNSAFTTGWWALYLNPDGTQLLFDTSTNGGGTTNLSAGISWYSNQWHQIALTYSPTGSALYVDGQMLANGSGVTCFPNADEQTHGFRIGSDQDGNNQAGGAFDELEAFNYPLDAANTYTHGSDIPDWWELKYFNQTGLRPDFEPMRDGVTLLSAYQSGCDPNVIKFTVRTTKLHVNTVLTPLQIRLSGGIPFYAAVLVNDINYADARWLPYAGSNVVATLEGADGVYAVRVGLRGLPPDAQQTWNKAALSVTLDRVAPVVVITNPVEDIASEATIQVQGIADEQLSSVTFDVSNAAGIFSNQTGFVTGEFYDTHLLDFTTNYFQCFDVALTNGANIITIHATDLAGNTTVTNVNLTLRYAGIVKPPVLTVIWPQDGTYISGGQFTFQGAVDKPGVTISAAIVDAGGNTNIVRGFVEKNGTVWVQNLPLAAGANTLTVTATDTAGNRSTNSLTLNQSSVTVTMNPLSGGQLNQSWVNVTGTVSDPGCSVYVNSVQASVNADGSWEADYVPASPGGMAIFDVEVYPGAGSSAVVRSGMKSSVRPADAGSGSNTGSAQFAVALPVKVGLMSYRCSSGYENTYPNQPSIDPLNESSYVITYGRWNWNYRSGGMSSGHYYYNGSMIPWADPVASCYWTASLTAGQDQFNPPSGCWEMASVAGAGPGGVGIWVRESTQWDETETRVMIEPPGQQAAGITNVYLVQAQAWECLDPLDGFYNCPLSPDTLQIGGVTLTLVTNADCSVWGQTLIAARAGENVEVTPKAPVPNYIFNVQAFSLDRVVAVDNDRNGQIMFDNGDATTAQLPFRLWINDSQESGDVSSADNDVPGSPSPNHARHQVNGRADVLNFFPVAFNLASALAQWPLTNSEYHLSQADNAVKMVYTGLPPGNAFDYLNNSLTPDTYGTNFDEAITNADTIPVLPSSAKGTVLDTNWLAHVQNNNGGQCVILMEGCKTSSAPLKLEIWQNGQKVLEIPCYISISGVEQMYRWINLRDSFQVQGETKPTINYPSRTGPPPNYPDSESDGKQVIHVHGFNISEKWARAEVAEVFKRLYQSHSRAMFTGVAWYGDQQYSQLLETSLDYYSNVRNAFLTASNLASAVANLPGAQKFIIGHSLGNMAVSSAIVDYRMKVDAYFAIDAAVAMEAYDGSIKDFGMVNPNAGYTFQGWQNYDQRLRSTEWYQLFDSSDGRHSLTWRNRFGAISNLYNFYSSGEDVLENPPNYQQLPPLGKEWCWVTQEMRKGTGLFDLLGDLWFVDSHPEAGWEGNADWDIPSDPAHPGSNLRPRYPLEAILSNFTDRSHVNTNELRSDPFFRPFNDSNLTGLQGSAEATNMQVRAEVLGVGIPALSHATGANPASVFIDDNGDRNISLMSLENGWPSIRPRDANHNPRWLHSDLKDVAYPFNHELYDTIVRMGL